MESFNPWKETHKLVSQESEFATVPTLTYCKRILEFSAKIVTRTAEEQKRKFSKWRQKDGKFQPMKGNPEIGLTGKWIRYRPHNCNLRGFWNSLPKLSHGRQKSRREKHNLLVGKHLTYQYLLLFVFFLFFLLAMATSSPWSCAIPNWGGAWTKEKLSK